MVNLSNLHKKIAAKSDDFFTFSVLLQLFRLLYAGAQRIRNSTAHARALQYTQTLDCGPPRRTYHIL